MNLIQGIIRKLIFPNIDTDRFKGRLVEKPTSKEMRYKTLQKIFSMLVTIKDYEALTQKMVNVMVEEMDFIGGVLFLPDEINKQLIPWSYTQSYLGQKVVGWLNKPFKEHTYPLNLDDNLTVQTYLTRKIHVGAHMSEFISPAVNASLADTMQKFMGMNLCISLPVIFLDKILGVVFFTSTRKEFSQEEQEMLKTFSDQVAIAINNIRQYEQIRNQLKNLEEKTQDLESLLSLNKMVSLGVEIEKSVQNIMDAVPAKLGHLGIMGTFLIRYDEDSGKACAYITTESDKMRQARCLLSKPELSDYSLIVDSKNSKNCGLVIKSILNNEIEKGSNIADFICPPLDKPTSLLIQEKLGGKTFASVPMTIRGEKKGALIFIFTKEITEVSPRDLDLINAFTQHVSVVMDNLQFYQNLNKNIEELTIAKDKLKNALDVKSDFLHIVSHQLRTPLTVMRGFISMWNAKDFDKATPEKKLEVKARIVDNTERLNNIVNDMVTATESEGELKLNFQPIDIRKMLQENIEMLNLNFKKKNLYLKYKRSSQKIPKIEADEKLLHNVFMNLIDNAEKYTEKGGLIIEVKREKDNVNIYFTDTGIGLSGDDKKILFQKFSRGKKSNYINPNGSGLGLFIAKQIIAKHHGKIKVISEGEGKGSTFIVSLPVRQGR
ncbi:MAG: GAF domain-containing sensor histidine kinase [bacterium]|nr:GAF domain-containing sensor histidine kinase [bacterium]